MKTAVNTFMTVATTSSLTAIAVLAFMLHSSPEGVAKVACDMGTSNTNDSSHCQSEFFPNN